MADAIRYQRTPANFCATGLASPPPLLNHGDEANQCAAEGGTASGMKRLRSVSRMCCQGIRRSTAATVAHRYRKRVSVLPLVMHTRGHHRSACPHWPHLHAEG